MKRGYVVHDRQTPPSPTQAKGKLDVLLVRKIALIEDRVVFQQHHAQRLAPTEHKRSAERRHFFDTLFEQRALIPPVQPWTIPERKYTRAIDQTGRCAFLETISQQT